MQRFQIDGRRRHFGFAVFENPDRTVEKLAPPLRDLIDMDIELLRQIG